MLLFRYSITKTEAILSFFYYKSIPKSCSYSVRILEILEDSLEEAQNTALTIKSCPLFHPSLRDIRLLDVVEACEFFFNKSLTYYILTVQLSGRKVKKGFFSCMQTWRNFEMTLTTKCALRGFQENDRHIINNGREKAVFSDLIYGSISATSLAR